MIKDRRELCEIYHKRLASICTEDDKRLQDLTSALSSSCESEYWGHGFCNAFIQMINYCAVQQLSIGIKYASSGAPSL